MILPDVLNTILLGLIFMVVLVTVVRPLVLNVVGSFVYFIGVLANLYLIAQIVPHLPLTVRRLRDSGKDWPWIFIGFIPVIGTIWMIVLLSQPSLMA